jgi:hypothetical protein
VFGQWLIMYGVNLMKILSNKFVVCFIITISLAFLISTSLFALGRDGPLGFDFAVMYAGGKAWLAGLNPYEQNELNSVVPSIPNFPYSTLNDAPFSYPPLSSALFIPLALLDYPLANFVWFCLNLVAIGLIIWVLFYTVDIYYPGKDARIDKLILAAYVIGSPLTSNVVHPGQTTLIVFSMVMATWLLHQKQRFILAGICLGMSAFKPQISVLLFVWFIFQRNWRILITLTITILILGIYPELKYGPIDAHLLWLERLKTHQDFGANIPGTQFAIGLQSLLVSTGLKIPSLAIFGVILTGVLWFYRRLFYWFDILAILMGLTLIFIFNLDTAYVIATPIILSLWLHSTNQPFLRYVVITCVCLFIFPRRIVRILANPLLNHWRTIIMIGFTFMLTKFSLAAQKSTLPDKIE